jgi:hypothetical protein
MMQLLPTTAFVVLLTLGIVAVWYFGLDADRGGYADGWTTTAAFPDKGCHFVAAFALALAAMTLGVEAGVAAVGVVVAGAGYELAQAHPRAGGAGFASWRDVVADAAGAALALVLWAGVR